MSILERLSLRRTRELVRRPIAWLLMGVIGFLFAFASMLVGQMLGFYPSGSTGTQVYLLTGLSPWWDYPGLLVLFPGGFIALPFLPTITMVLVSAGVALGATAGLTLAFPRQLGAPRPRAVGVAGAATGGAAPAITGLGTLGACCCTTCVGTAGIAVVAATAGASPAMLLGQAWYLNLFQLAVVFLSLLVLERALATANECLPARPPSMRRRLAVVGLRLTLVVGGLTWSLGMFVEWAVGPGPAGAGAPLWYHWVVEHQLLGGLAILAGLSPELLGGAWSWLSRSRLARIAGRVALTVGGISWGIGVFPPLPSIGLGGLANELLGVWGVGGAWAVAPDSTLGAALLFHWLVQHALLGGFAVAFAARPWSVLRLLGRPGAEPEAVRPPSPSESTRGAPAGSSPEQGMA